MHRFAPAQRLRAAHRTIHALLFALAALCGCDPDPGRRFDGPVSPCDVSVRHAPDAAVAWRAEGLQAAERRAFWRRGPYPIWVTTPSLDCRDDERAAQGTRRPDTRLQITYPAATAPDHSGVADIAPGQFPVVVFAHANNDRTCEIYHRYYDLHDHLASWGFVVVSVDAADLNCQSGTHDNIQDRADGQVAAVESLRAWDADPTHWLHGHVDTTRVVMMGHSRGGGASIVSAQDAAVRDSVRAIVDFQGIDVTSYGFGTPDLQKPLLGFTAGRDVDLNYPYVDPTEDLASGPYTWVNIYGGVHAWTASSTPEEPDDVPAITPAQQHGVGAYFTTAFLAHHLGVATDDTGPPFATIDASAILYGHEGAETIDREVSARGVAVRGDDASPDTLWIDTFDDLDAPDVTLAGAPYEVAGMWRHGNVYTYFPYSTPRSNAYLKSRARLIEVYPDERGFVRAWLTPERAPITLPRGASLVARVKGGDRRRARFDVVLHSPDGDVRVPGRAHIGPEPLTSRYTQLIVPLSALPATPGEDASVRLRAITFEVEDGALLLDDLRITGARR